MISFKKWGFLKQPPQLLSDPSGIDHLSRLTSLNLSYAVFLSQIPSTLPKLFELSSLVLSHDVDPFDVAKPLLQLNYNPSSLQSLVYNMTTLEELNLDKVDVSSVVPLALGKLTSLRSISFLLLMMVSFHLLGLAHCWCCLPWLRYWGGSTLGGTSPN